MEIANCDMVIKLTLEKLHLALCMVVLVRKSRGARCSGEKGNFPPECLARETTDEGLVLSTC